MEELGATVLRILNASTSNMPVPDPGEIKNRLCGVLRLAGVKSWKGLVDKATACGTEFEGTQVAVIPQIRGGKNAYFPLMELKEVIPAQVRIVGEALLRGFTRSR